MTAESVTILSSVKEMLNKVLKTLEEDYGVSDNGHFALTVNTNESVQDCLLVHCICMAYNIAKLKPSIPGY